MRYLFAIVFTIIASNYAFCETIQLSKMDSQTSTYIIRGSIGTNVDCYFELIKSIEKRGLSEKDIWVTFDDPKIDGLGVGFDGSDEYYTCENGELRSWEMGKYRVLKRY